MAADQDPVSNKCAGSGTVPRSVFFFGFLCAAAAVCLCSNPTPATDLFWQLRAGRDIALSHHLPTIDRYSWTERGVPWIAPEWLSFFLFWEAYRSGGYGGVWLMTSALAAAIGIGLWLGVRRSFESDMPAFALTGAVLYGIGPFLQPRPQMWSYIGFLIGLTILQAGLVDANARKRLWLLVPLCVVWANLHQGVLLFVALLVLVSMTLSAVSIVRRQQGAADSVVGDWGGAGRLWMVTVACAMATMITPYGWKLYEVTIATIGSAQAMADVPEWWPLWALGPRFVIPVAVLALTSAICYWTAYSSGAPTCDAVVRRRSIVLGAAILIPLCEQAALHVRQAPFFLLAVGIIAAPAVAVAIRRMRNPFAQGTGSSFLPGIASVGLVAIAVAGLMLPSLMALAQALRPAEGAGVLERIGRSAFLVDTFPSGACRFIYQERLPAAMRMFNSYSIGGYLIWALPEHPVFVDGRADLYLKREMADFDKIGYARSMDGCRDVVERYGIDLVVTDGGHDTRPFAGDPDWATVYRDYRIVDGHPIYNSWVFIRRRPEYAALIARCQSDFTAHPPPLQ